MTTIRSETARDVSAREALLDDAFGFYRHEKTCELLRENRMPARGLSLIAEDHGCVIGTVRLWHIEINGQDALLLGPLAVAVSHQARGIGRRLMRTALNRAAMLGHKAVILVGDGNYYARFGFSKSVMAGIDLPGPVDRHRFLGLELKEGALSQQSGMVVATGEIIINPLPLVAQSRMQPVSRAA